MSVGASWRDDPAWPDVDVVMPIRNEIVHLEAAVESVRAQAYPGALRIYLGVGPSEDGTEALAERLAAESGDLAVVENPSGTIPAGLNAAIAAGAAPVVVRVDGHCELGEGYVRRAVETLRHTGAANVGGRQVPAPTTDFERAVADATTSWLGTGGATYRMGGEAGPVDTVYLGVYDRGALTAIGGYDETLLANEDYELNIRLRAAGDIVWFDPRLSVGYRPRSSWRALVRQYHNYGRWKAEVLRRHPSSLRLRQFLPPLSIVAALSGAVVGTRRPRCLLVPAGYLLIVATGAKGRPRRIVVAATIHLAWSLGLLSGGERTGR